MVEHTQKLIELLEKNPDICREILCRIKIVNQQHPPAKNENKFITGKCSEIVIIEEINKISEQENCEDLDKNHSQGAEYLNDCIIGNNKYSIKCCKARHTSIVIVNKQYKDKHFLDGLSFIIFNLSRESIYIFKYEEKLKQFVENTSSQVKFKSGIFNFLEKEQSSTKKYFYKIKTDKTIINKIEQIKEDESIYIKIARESNKIYNEIINNN